MPGALGRVASGIAQTTEATTAAQLYAGALGMDAIAAKYGVPVADVQAWAQRGAPIDNPDALADWVMTVPSIRAGYERTQAVAELLPGLARRAAAAGDTEFAAEILDALTGWLSSPQCRAYWRVR